MAILAGFDVHRAQITFDALNTETGEVLRGPRCASRLPWENRRRPFPSGSIEWIRIRLVVLC